MAEHKAPIQKPDKPPLVELKNGKLVFRQKPLSLEKLSETMQEIVLFRSMLEERAQKKEGALDTIPDQHKPLIAKLVHESDKTLVVLSKNVLQELLPVCLEDDDDDENSKSVTTDLLSIRVVEAAIKSVANRTNYGLDSNPSGGKLSNQMCIWRWEVPAENHAWLPRSLKDKINTRLAERLQAKKDVEALVESLSSDERTAFLGSKIPPKESSKQKQTSVEPVVTSSNSNEIVVTPAQKEKSKKSQAPEKVEKEKEKQEKKMAKAEKEKKAKDAQNKSRNLMANFFGKPKAPELATDGAFTSAPKASGSKSDFEKTFKSFALKKGSELAPVNWFREAPRLAKALDGNDVIVIDGDNVSEDVEMKETHEIGDVSANERLDQILTSLSQLPSTTAPRRLTRRVSNLKSTSRHSVKAVLAEIAEAEISGDASTVRSLLNILQNRALVPAKVLIFAEDSRPGYLGTWTRDSSVVGPRTPFARDTVALDYSYDSGEEWEEESGDADDVVEGEDDDDQDDGKDSDADSWLVDDDEAEPEVSPDDMELLSLAPTVAKRKATVSELAKPLKKRKVVPLVPFIKGPCWESSIGRTVDILNPYRIKLFNDTPCPIDPFTYDSTSDSKPQASSDPRFAVPALPDHILSSSKSSNTNPPQPTTTKKASSLPKQSFPDAHVPALLAKIKELATGSLMLIVEAIYQDLKEQKVKKNSIESKVKELAAKQNKIWVVKSEVPPMAS